nr:glycosyl hydrolase 115 family protein [Lachnospiraceae bacterium]
YDPQAICCSNLYGETMELYQQGYLEIPEDVILIWADNGFGKMVSRRQGDHNPRVYALPPKDHTGKHGIYYHVSFYDLQAAAQMTMLPNAPEFVETELQTVQELGVTDYWIINCSNVKPHAYYLDLIARIWRGGETVDFTASYCRETYGAEAGGVMEALYRMWPKVSPSYGPNADDHAGEQFANHGARVLVSAQIAGCDPADPERTAAAREWKWFSDKETLREQTTDYLQIIEPALTQYEQYLTKCREAEDQLSLPRRVQAEDTLIWQVEYLYYSYLGALHSCRAILTISDPLEAFYEAGLAMQAFQTGYEMMRSHEHGVFVGFFANDCEADIRQSGYVLKGLMSFLRIRADGPHFYKWQRLFQDGAGGDRVLLILRTKKHLTDEELWRLMNEKRK